MMNPDAGKGTSLAFRMRLMLLGAAVFPVLVILGLGAWANQQLDQVLQADQKTTIWIATFVCAILCMVVIAYLGYSVQRQVHERAVGLTEVCKEVASGNQSVRARVIGDDEFAMLAASINAVLDGSGKGGSLDGTREAASLQAQIEKLLQEVSAVGDGDLRVTAEVTPDTLGVLADSFNYMIEELAKLVTRVQTTSSQVASATRRILDRSAELAQASEQQAAQIAQTTEAVESLANFIQGTARNAQLSTEAAQEALRHAHAGEQAVTQTIEGMQHIRENVQDTSKKIKRLGERSQEIGEIVRIIEDLADQTNLLALNAAIQSAMAGEHGRGFSVVADEIRQLAERSGESAKKISTLVKGIQGDTYEAVVAMEESTQEVVSGSRLADEAGRALKMIYTAMERQAQMIEMISRAANERAQTSEAVALAMNQISEITRQTSAASQDAAASVNYLAELAEQLRASVAQFRLPERASTDALEGAPGNMPALLNMPAMPYEGQGRMGWSALPGEEYGMAGLPALPPHNGQAPMAAPMAPRYNGQQAFPANQPMNGQPAYNQGQQFPDMPFGNRPFTNQQPYE